MTHASMETLVALLDGELNELEERRTTRHLEACAECSEELAELAESRTLFAWALERVDEGEPRAWPVGPAATTPVSDPAAILPGPRTPDAVAIGAGSGHRLRRTALRWAAGLVLVAGAAAGAIMTPVIVDRFFPGESPGGESATPEALPAGGVAVQPVDGAAVVALSGEVESTRLQVIFEARSDVMMDYRGGRTAFVARDGELSARLEGGVTVLRLRVPRDAREVRVLVNGEPAALLAEGEAVRLRADLGLTFEVVSAER